MGKPNVGKSTFFSAATSVRVSIANYPFTTILPNRGIGYVKSKCVCTTLDVRDEPRNSRCVDGVRQIPVEILDCAGLVPGAWQGRGLGNQFLDELRAADALIQVVDVSGSTDAEGKPCKEGSRNPLEDVAFLHTELNMWFHRILSADWPKVAKHAASPGRTIIESLVKQLSGLGVTKFHVQDALEKSSLESKPAVTWSREDLERLAAALREICKPVLIAANKMDLPTSKLYLDAVRGLPLIVVPTSAESELALSRAAEKQLIRYSSGDGDFQILEPGKLSMQQLAGLEKIRSEVLTPYGSTGVQDCLNRSYFELLHMITVYPVSDPESYTDHKGRVLPDAYLVPSGSTIFDLAEKIHSDLSTGFLYGIEARSKKRVGQEYVLRDGDIVSIVSTKAR